MIPEVINLEVVECTKTSDGLLFENTDAALAHEKEIIFNRELKELIENSDFEMHIDNIKMFIKEYRNELKQLLNI